MYEKLEKARDSRVVVYVTGDRRGQETQMASEVVDLFVDHLDLIGVVDRISLLIHTRGGETLSAWSLANLLHSFGDHLEVIVPSRCHSAGTLLCLGADGIVLTKQATLGPIDPSVNTPLNPAVEGAQPQAGARVPVSVEDVNAFLGYAREELGQDGDLLATFDRLAQAVHPIVLGNAFRARSQIRMLGERLLRRNHEDGTKIEKILDFLCSDSGSHDYTINRREAREELGLPVEKPSWELYKLIKEIYEDTSAELELRIPYDPNLLLGSNEAVNYSISRGLVESREGGSHAFISEGILTRQQIQLQPGTMQDAIGDQRQFEGWRHRNA